MVAGAGMGIKGLMKVIGDNAPGALREQKFESYFGRKIAIDASMHLYQFLVVVGRTGEGTLTNEAGEVTAHLQGMLYRTRRLLLAGIKPIYVFDGKPPEMKGGELLKRAEKRKEAAKELEAAKERGDQAEIEKHSKRTVRVSPEMNADCKRLLTLMGVPYVDAPCEAEAQCAVLAKAGQCYAVATEDMDALTFGTTLLTRHLMTPASQKKDVMQVNLPRVLEAFGMTMAQFIDFCILCGCDYTDSIRGIGPKRAFELIKQHKDIETLLEHIDKTKFPVPEPFPYKEARAMFTDPEVKDVPNSELKWTPPDKEGLVAFLVKEKGFDQARVEKICDELTKAKGKSTQGRLESFFGPVSIKSSTLGKRKEADKGGKKKAGGALKKKGGKFGVSKRR